MWHAVISFSGGHAFIAHDGIEWGAGRAAAADRNVAAFCAPRPAGRRDYRRDAGPGLTGSGAMKPRPGDILKIV